MFGTLDCFWDRAIEASDLFEGSQSVLCVGGSERGYLVDGATSCDGLEAIVQYHTVVMVVERAAGGDEWNVAEGAPSIKDFESLCVVWAEVEVCEDVGAIWEEFSKCGEPLQPRIFIVGVEAVTGGAPGFQWDRF